MKKNIIKLFALVAVALVGWSCETDYFNEHNLDGYEPETEITDVQAVEYTLVAADYAAIASNASNKEIAAAAGTEAVAALAAVKTNCYFTSSTDAETYIKAFVSNKYNNYLSNGSSVSVNYNLSEGYPEELQAMNAAKPYSVSDDEYKKVWESETEFQSYVTPATLDKLAGALSSEGLEAGDYVAVTYNYSEEEPSTDNEEPSTPDTPDTPDTPTSEYTSVLGSTASGAAVEVKGYISAVSTMGPILTDDGGSVLLYDKNNAAYPALKIGDKVTVSGTMGAYKTGLQIDASKGAVVTVTGTTDKVTYPTPTELTGEVMNTMKDRTENEPSLFVKVTGTMKVSESNGFINYNLIIDGAESCDISAYGPTAEVIAQFKDGETATIYGYLTGITGSSTKHFSTVCVSINEEPAIDNGNDEPETPANNYTSVLGTVKAGDVVEVKGYISAISKQGPILTDNSGSIWLYKNSDGYVVGDEVTVNATVSAYNTCLQIETKNTVSIEKTGTTDAVTYPSPVEMTGEKMDAELTARTADQAAVYVKMTGTASVGSYINFVVDGAATAQGSVYGATDDLKAILTDGLACTIYGYYVSISSSKFLNVIVTKVETATAATALYASRAAVQSEKKYGFFKWDGSKFTAVDMKVIQPSDYTEMGQTYGSFTDPAQDKYIPKYLNKELPYAMEEETALVAYRCYAGGTTSWRVDEFIYNGTTWARNLNIEEGNAPFKKIDGKWAFNPSKTIVVAPDKSEFSKMYYQAAVDYVYNNKHENYTFDNRSNARISNAEYYSGCSADYTNLNWRINTLPKHYWGPAGEDVTPYADWGSEDKVVAKAVFQKFYTECEKRFGETMAAALGTLHPNQKKIDGMDVIYTVQMMVYANASNLGSSTGRVTHAFEFKVVGDGQFEYVRMYALDPKFDLYLDFN